VGSIPGNNVKSNQCNFGSGGGDGKDCFAS
jgi:hypothetical protein